MTTTQIHRQAIALASTSDAQIAIIAASKLNRWGRYAARNDTCNKLADHRLVRLARQLAAATKAGF